MKGKYWPDHLAAGYIEVGGQRYSLVHLRKRVFSVTVDTGQGHLVTLSLHVEFSSHCVSKGEKKDQNIDFSVLGYDHLLIDARGRWRAFHPGRHSLSALLPFIVSSLAERHCLFTGHENFLTIELDRPLPGYPAGSRYEVYFSARQGGSKNSVRIIIESAYVRDEDADNEPYKFKKDDRIKGERLLLKKARGEPIRKPPKRG